MLHYIDNKIDIFKKIEYVRNFIVKQKRTQWTQSHSLIQRIYSVYVLGILFTPHINIATCLKVSWFIQQLFHPGGASTLLCCTWNRFR